MRMAVPACAPWKIFPRVVQRFRSSERAAPEVMGLSGAVHVEGLFSCCVGNKIKVYQIPGTVNIACPKLSNRQSNGSASVQKWKLKLE